jgi:dTDP-4-amino-4,6-dideoxygalactose transaminase
MKERNSRIPLHRPSIGEEEIAAALAVLRSGWLTTGEQCHRFEEEFAAFLGARHAVAVNSCTAALHLALEATGLARGGLVLVPTHTFAATAEVVTYFGATLVLVDVEPEALTIDVEAARRTLAAIERGEPAPGVPSPWPAHAIMPVHFAGQMADVDGVAALAREHNLRVVEDAAHALPAAVRGPEGKWRSVGTTAEQTCFSFYATKTITTGEGGMLVTDDDAIAARVRRMSLHGLSNDAWNRFAGGGGWSYRILSTGFKYNLTDLAAAIGRQQLRKARRLAEARAHIAARYRDLLDDVEEIELPTVRAGRLPSWHLYVMRLHLDRLTIDRREFVDQLRAAGIGVSVHWMPLHLHPYYREVHGYRPEDFPVATREFERLISLPIYPGLAEEEIERVAAEVRGLARRHARGRAA